MKSLPNSLATKGTKMSISNKTIEERLTAIEERVTLIEESRERTRLAVSNEIKKLREGLEENNEPTN